MDKLFYAMVFRKLETANLYCAVATCFKQVLVLVLQFYNQV